MQKIIRRLFSLMLSTVLSLAATPSWATVAGIRAVQPAAQLVTEEQLEAISQEIQSVFKRRKAFGGGIAIAYQGEIIYEQYYGLARKSEKYAAGANTYFRTASVTKLISAIGVMQLVEQGILDLDEDISAYLGYKVANAYYPNTPITLRMLMSHTSSLNMGGGYNRLASRLDDMLAAANKRYGNYYDYRPGSKYEYSNFGAGIMGSLVEAVTGQSINDYMQQHVFQPLGIDAAYHPTLLQDPEDVSSIYQTDGSSKKGATTYLAEAYDNTADPNGHYRITVGSLWIRTNDLAKLLTVLCGDGTFDGVRILTQDSVLAMRESQQGQGGITAKGPYGLSMARVENLVSGRMIYGHQGMDESVVCNAYFDPETTLCVAIMTNGCDPTREDRISILARSLMPYAYAVAGLEYPN